MEPTAPVARERPRWVAALPPCVAFQGAMLCVGRQTTSQPHLAHSCVYISSMTGLKWAAGWKLVSKLRLSLLGVCSRRVCRGWRVSGVSGWAGARGMHGPGSGRHY